MALIDWSQIAAISAAATAIIAAMMSTIIFVFLRDRNRSRYNDDRHMAVLSEMRASYETQIAMISRQLVATEERWRDANHLILTSQERQPELVPSSSQTVSSDDFIRSLGIDPATIKVDTKLVFVLTPFSKSEESVFEVVQKVCQRNGLRCARGDEEHVSGDILPHVVRMILSARIVVANVSSRNPNVFYELGITHALGKKSVLISEAMERVPFDIQSRRVIIFSTPEELDQRWSDALVRTFSGVDQPGS